MKTAMGSAIMVLAMAAIAVAGIQLGQYQNQPPTINNRARQPLVFVQNLGQWDSRVEYRAASGDAAFYFGKGEVNYLFSRNTDRILEDPNAGLRMIPDKIHRTRYQQEQIMITAQFMGISEDAKIAGGNQLAEHNNYFIGTDKNKWRTHVPCYDAITYIDIYPGIDMRYYGDGRSLKYDFIVAPGADISKIRVRYEGISDLGITNDGSLSAISQFGPVYEMTPYIYQERNGEKSEISGRYILKNNNEFGFVIDGGYDSDLPLVIDPELVYSTYLGGSEQEWCEAMTVNDYGEVYVAGYTCSQDFPILNPYQPALASEPDIFITRLNAAGNAIIGSTFLGGATGGELAYDIALDNYGNAYITGYSNSWDYPLVNPCFYHHASNDVIVSKLSSGLDSLIYSTYIGGNARESADGIAVDYTGCAYITGTTESTDYPTKNAMWQNMPNNDSFVSKLGVGGDSLIYSTYLGGNSVDAGWGIAVDKECQAYAVGYAASADFPLLYSPQQYVYMNEVYITKFNPRGDALRYSTLIAGSNTDVASGIVLDDEGCAYITGFTKSSDFPTLNPFQGYGGDYDAIAAKLEPTLCIRDFCTYIGGSDYDEGNGIAIDSKKNIYIVGSTASTNFPTLNPFQTDHELWDAYLIELDSTGRNMLYSTYLGGSEGDYAYGVAVDRYDNIYVVGSTYSDDFPTLNPYQTAQGWGNAFIMKFANTSSINNGNAGIPTGHSLGNYPNPFNSNTLIQYQIDTKASVAIAIYNILGEQVAILCDETQEPGAHSLSWNAAGVSSGTYLCRLEIGGKAEYTKMTLVK
jgi:hypothetical protein